MTKKAAATTPKTKMNKVRAPPAAMRAVIYFLRATETCCNNKIQENKNIQSVSETNFSNGKTSRKTLAAADGKVGRRAVVGENFRRTIQACTLGHSSGTGQPLLCVHFPLVMEYQ